MLGYVNGAPQWSENTPSQAGYSRPLGGGPIEPTPSVSDRERAMQRAAMKRLRRQRKAEA